MRENSSNRLKLGDDSEHTKPTLARVRRCRRYSSVANPGASMAVMRAGFLTVSERIHASA